MFGDSPLIVITISNINYLGVSMVDFTQIILFLLVVSHTVAKKSIWLI